MNQGFKFAKDEFIIYLNAGDIFSENSLLYCQNNYRKLF